MIVRHAGSSLTEHSRIQALAEMMAPIVAELRDIERTIGKSHNKATERFLFGHAVRQRHLESLALWRSLEMIGLSCPATDTEYAAIVGETDDQESAKSDTVSWD